MIPIDRKEIDNHAVKSNHTTTNDEQQSKNKETINTINEKSSENDDVDDDDLFCGTDIDYRDTENSQSSNVPNSDTDRLFKLNSECLSLAEEKFKSKELSSEEYQATLKLLQTILQNEVQRLTVPSTNSTTTTTSSFPNPSLSFPSNTTTTSATTPATAAATTLPTFPYAGFGNDTQRHALQILTAANATSAYAMPYNFLPFLPPLPPAPVPPPFTLAAATLPPTDRLSPNKKRTPDDNSNSNLHSDQMTKRQRRNSPTSTTHFHEETIAPVPSLVDANINLLKKKYLGVIQQLYIGKSQCRLCGLRFTSEQNEAYKNHLDLHYWENRQAATNQSNLLERCRDWYPSRQDWIIHEENIKDQIKATQIMLKENQQTKELYHQTSSSNDILSCSAKGDGDIDNDVCYTLRKKKKTLNLNDFYLALFCVS